MARIENWDRIKKTIIVLKHDPYDLDQKIFHEIELLKKRQLALLYELGRFVDIYVPDRHPLMERNMLKEGKVIELSDVIYMIPVDGDRKRHLSEKKSLFLIDKMTPINDLTNIIKDDTLEKIGYDGEKYHRVSGIIYDDKEVIRIPGVQQRNLK